MHKLPIPVRFQGLSPRFRAREIVALLDNGGLDAAIETARAALVSEKRRRQYLLEILPGGLAYAIPGSSEAFGVECTDGRTFHLQQGTLPLLWQILHLEVEQGVQVVKVIHDDGHRRWIYCL